MSAAAFDQRALDAFAEAYPEQPARLTHNLVGHAMFELDALASLAGRMRPGTALCFEGKVPVGVGQTDVPATGRTPQETIAAIERCGSWMVLKFIEQDPAYRALLDDLLGELEALVRPVTGPMLQREAFVFVSSPGAVTPFHFDPEHNILMQLRGEKVMTLFPVADESLVPGTAHEAFHRHGRNNLEWDEGFAARGLPFRLAPGDALHVPVKAPHWVQNRDAPSVSLSITWRSGWSLREGYAHGMNRLLRRIGLSPRAPRRFPAENHAKALAYRAIEKARRAGRIGA